MPERKGVSMDQSSISIRDLLNAPYQLHAAPWGKRKDYKSGMVRLFYKDNPDRLETNLQPKEAERLAALLYRRGYAEEVVGPLSVRWGKAKDGREFARIGFRSLMTDELFIEMHQRNAETLAAELIVAARYQDSAQLASLHIA